MEDPRDPLVVARPSLIAPVARPGEGEAESSARWVALLRGINVGGHRVKMDRLRELFSELALSDVASFIASGNVIFTGPGGDRAGLEATISAHLESALGFEVATFLRTPAELAAVAAFEPDPDAREPETVHVIFHRAPLGDGTRRAIRALESGSDRFAFEGRETYWLIRGKLSESPLFGGDVTRALAGVPHTMRNLGSVRKLVAKHPPPA